MINNLRIKTKLLIILVIILLTFVSLFSLSIYNDIELNNKNLNVIENTIRKDYDANIKKQVNNVISLLNGIYKKYKSGEYTLQEAKKLSADLVRDLRYDNDAYFWIDTLDGTNVVLLGSSTEGKNRYNFKDIKGNLVLQEVIRKSLQPDGGYTNYWFPKPGSNTPLPKRAFSKYFKPFNWVIGTGNYVDDIDNFIAKQKNMQHQELNSTINELLIIIFIALILIGICIYIVGKDIIPSLLSVTEQLNIISAGNLKIKISEKLLKRKDEIGDIAKSCRRMQNSIVELIERVENNQLRYKALLKANPDMMFVISNDEEIVDFKADSDEDLYISSDKFINKKIADLFPPNFVNLTTEKMNIVRKTGQMVVYEYSLYIGGDRFFESRLVPFGEDKYLSIVRNITERKLLEKFIHEEKELLLTTLISVGDGVISTDSNGNIKLMNKAAEDITGFSKCEVCGNLFDEIITFVNDKTNEICISPIQHILKIGDSIQLDDNTLLVSKNGTKISIESTASPIKDREGKIIGAVIVFKDIREKKKKQSKIEFLSFHDQLTGLYNRRFFEEQMNSINNEYEHPISLIMSDVNGLKLTNDAFGHLIGDALIKTTAKVLDEATRKGDTVARIGGDEFVILLPKTNTEDANIFVERLKKKIALEKVGPIDVSISIGVATKYTSEEKMEDLFKKAEDKMYEEKLQESPKIKAKMIKSIAEFFNNKYPKEGEHLKEVSRYAGLIGKALGFDLREIKELETAASLHDIGKATLEEKVMDISHTLSESEINELKRHPLIGYHILTSSSDMAKIAEYILQHHECWDGSGYPNGVSKEDIPIQSRIIAVANMYDCMINDTVYGKAVSKDEAIAQIKLQAGKMFDPKVVEKFLEIV